MTTHTLTPSCLLNTGITLLQGPTALPAMQHTVFTGQWDSLADQCAWATVYQRKEFVLTWYETYQAVYQPVVVYETKNGALTGLLTLVQDTAGNLTGAGTNQAEYQVWLSVDSGCFIQDALLKIKETFPNKLLQLKYLPAGTPVELLQQHGQLRNYCLLQEYRQPLMQLEADQLQTELRKKNRREKLNRIKRQGDLRFERITNVEAFDAALTELMPQYDFRKGATVNLSPFQDDPYKKEFLLRLFLKDVLHVSLLKLNKTIIASNVGAVSQGCLHLQGLNTHSPFHAKHSPGILHFLMLGQHLCSEGFRAFDLTPGGDSYKEQLATHAQAVHLLTFGAPHRLLLKAQKRTWSARVKKAVNRFWKSPYAWKQLKQWGLNTHSKLRTGVKQGLLASLKTWLPAASHLSCYLLEPGKPLPHIPAAVRLQHNELSDLLEYKANGFTATRWEFLASAMKKFENGEQCYTYRSGQGLAACIWLKPPLAGTAGPALLHHLYLTEPGLAPALLTTCIQKIRVDYPNTPILLELPKRLNTGNLPLYKV